MTHTQIKLFYNNTLEKKNRQKNRNKLIFLFAISTKEKKKGHLIIKLLKNSNGKIIIKNHSPHILKFSCNIYITYFKYVFSGLLGHIACTTILKEI